MSAYRLSFASTRGVGWFLLISALVSCGPALPPERPLPGTVNNSEAPLVLGERVERITASGRPTLQMIRRAGDPQGAIALAVFPPGGSSESLQLANLFRTRLQADDGGGRGSQLSLQVHAIGFVFALEVGSPEAAKHWIEKFHQILSTQVSGEEAVALQSHHFLKSALGRVGEASPYQACMGQLGAEGRTPLLKALEEAQHGDYAAQLERLRAASVGAGRVGLAALGDPLVLQAVSQAHERDWPEGAVLDDSWRSKREVGITQSAGGRELRLALRVADSEAALAGARALRDGAHPIHARLHALNSHIHAENVEVSLRPAGACAGLTLRIDSESSRPSIHLLAQATIIAQEEMQAAISQSLAKDEANLALLSPRGATEAVALGAWTAVRSMRTGAEVKEVVEYRAPPEGSLSREEFASTLEQTRASWESLRIPVVSAKEAGQRELWLVLASSCGTSPEMPEEAGLRALTVSSLAEHFSGQHGVTLGPWVSTEAIGLTAHAPPLRGEAPEMHASRVARALAAAFAGPPLDGRVVAARRAAQLQRLGSDPANALINNILGGGYPSMVQPWGDEEATATFSTADVERTRLELSQEPLRLALLETSESPQAKAAQEALSQWLAPLRQHVTSCGSPMPEPPKPGLWELETIDDHVQEGAYVGVWSPAPRHLGRATEYLLNRPNGHLARALLLPGLAASAEARWLGGPKFGGLTIRVSAEPGQLDRAIAQTRALLDRLSKGASSEADARLAAESFHRSQEALARTQVGRVISLWLGAVAVDNCQDIITANALRGLHRSLAAAQHRVVKTKIRR